MVESDSTVDDTQDNDDSEKASTVSREIDANYAINFISKVKVIHLDIRKTEAKLLQKLFKK